MSEQNVYLDNAASTRVDEEVLEAMKPYFFDTYAVATSEFAYSMGIDAKEGLEEARETITSRLGCNADEFIFTSGGTESSNLALKGVAEASKNEGNHIIVSEIEDFPVLNSAKYLEKNGFDVTYVGVDEEGFVDREQLEDSINSDTILVSIQHANQEIGTIQDIQEIAEFCQERDIIYHTDATHTFKRVPLNLQEIPADLVTVAAHTIHGPRGIGALFLREGVELKKLIDRKSVV